MVVGASGISEGPRASTGAWASPDSTLPDGLGDPAGVADCCLVEALEGPPADLGLFDFGLRLLVTIVLIGCHYLNCFN